MALRSPLTVQPYDYIGDSNGRPLDKGQIYIGVAGQDPEFNQIPIYLDAEMTKLVDQPIRTNDGFVDFAGSLQELYALPKNYSVKVLDKEGRKVLYKGDMTRKNLMSDALAELTQAVDETMSIARESLDTFQDISSAVNLMEVVTGEAGTDVSFVNTGTPIARNFVLTVPKGVKGDTGADAKITSVSATTGVAGSAVSVSMGGTPTARTFNFTIPRGDKGDVGALPNFYATTTANPPNTNIAADGSQKRSSYAFGTAATKNVGTAAGNLVERGADGYPTNNNALGVGQTWQNMIASRVVDTSYTNSTGRPIFVTVSCNSTSGSVVEVGIFATVDGVSADKQQNYGNRVGFILSVSFVVPSGSVYKITKTSTFALTDWSELR